MVETDSASIKPMVGSASDYSSMGVTAAEFDRQRIMINIYFGLDIMWKRALS